MSTTDVEDLVIQVRDHYVAQFRDFILRQRDICTTGHQEVKFQLPDTSAFHQLVVVDFVRNDAAPEAIFFEPEAILTFEKIGGNIAQSELVIESLRWDAVVIRHDAPLMEEVLESWFIKWFDPDEISFNSENELSNCIHSVHVEPQHLQVDFGTAPAEAFWELLDCVEKGGATSITVCS